MSSLRYEDRLKGILVDLPTCRHALRLWIRDLDRCARHGTTSEDGMSSGGRDVRVVGRLRILILASIALVLRVVVSRATTITLRGIGISWLKLLLVDGHVGHHEAARERRLYELQLHLLLARHSWLHALWHVRIARLVKKRRCGRGVLLWWRRLRQGQLRW